MENNESTLSQIDPTPPFVPLIAGGLAGVTVDVALYPLDTLKTRLQASQGFLKAGGFSGVYRGMQSVALGSAPGSALFFTAYEMTAPMFTKLFHANSASTRLISGRSDGLTVPSTSSTLGHLAAASFGEFAACLVRVPTDHLKMRLQAGESTSLLTALQATQRVSNAGIYKGFGITLTREIPFSMIQFPLYEHLKRKVFDHKFNRNFASLTQAHPHMAHEELVQRAVAESQLSPIISSLIGACCGFIAAAATTPLDVVRTRIMLGNDPYGQPYQSNPITAMQRIFTEGCRVAKYHATNATTSGNVDAALHPTLAPGDLHKYARGGASALFKGVLPRVTWISIGGCVYFGAFESYRKMCLTFSSQQKNQNALQI